METAPTPSATRDIGYSMRAVSNSARVTANGAAG